MKDDKSRELFDLARQVMPGASIARCAPIKPLG